jgi:hypothetical protein
MNFFWLTYMDGIDRQFMSGQDSFQLSSLLVTQLRTSSLSMHSGPTIG